MPNNIPKIFFFQENGNASVVERNNAIASMASQPRAMLIEKDGEFINSLLEIVCWPRRFNIPLDKAELTVTIIG